MITLKQALRILKKAILKDENSFVEETTLEDVVKKHCHNRRLKTLSCSYSLPVSNIAHAFLTLPLDTKIYMVDRDIMRGEYVFALESSVFPEQKEGAILESISVKIRHDQARALQATVKLLGLKHD